MSAARTQDLTSTATCVPPATLSLKLSFPAYLFTQAMKGNRPWIQSPALSRPPEPQTTQTRLRGAPTHPAQTDQRGTSGMTNNDVFLSRTLSPPPKERHRPH